MSARLLLAVVGSLAVAGSVAAQTQTLKTEAKLSPDGSDVLAEGPFVGTIESVNGGVGNVPPVKHKDVIVRFVTRKAVYFQEKEGPLYDPRSLSAETTKFLRVSATVGGPDTGFS